MDSGVVSTGSTVKFRVGTAPDSIGTFLTPLTVDTVAFEPDPDSLGGDYSEAKTVFACAFTNRQCTRQIAGSGTLKVIAHVNGRRFIGTAHVGTRDRLRLKAVRAYISAGDSVTFTPSMSDGSTFTPYGWSWKADSVNPARTAVCPWQVSPCRTRVFEHGWMTITVFKNGVQRKARAHVTVGPRPDLVLTSDKDTVLSGDSVTFVARAGEAEVENPAWSFEGVTVEDCAGRATCRLEMRRSGTMTVTATIDGEVDAAHKSVTVLESFTLEVAPQTLPAGGLAVFRPFLDNAPTSATAWRWVPNDPDSWDVEAGCSTGLVCRRIMYTSGTMWAYRTTSRQTLDSASAIVTVEGSCSGSPLSATRLGGSRLRVPPRTMLRNLDPGAQDPCDIESAAGDSIELVTLTVTPTRGVDGLPLEPTKRYPKGTVVPYRYGPRTGFVDIAVVVSDTFELASGAITMDQNRSVEAASDSNYAADPYIASLMSRLNNMVNATDKVAAYRDFMLWLSQERTRVGPRLDVDLATAEVLALNPHTEANRLAAFHAELGGTAFFVFQNGENAAFEFVRPSTYVGDTVPPLANRAFSVAPLNAATLGGRNGVLVYVNGINTFLATGDSSTSRLRDLLPFDVRTRAHIALLYNPTFVVQRQTWASPAGCAVYYARASNPQIVPMAVFEYSVGLLKATECKIGRKLNNAARHVTEQDIMEAFAQLMETLNRTVLEQPAPTFVSELSAFIEHQHKKWGNHTIFVTHSQGNMMLANALQLLPVRSRCVAEVTMASPVPRSAFPLQPQFLRGLTVDLDILLQLHPLTQNDFIVDTTSVSRAARDDLEGKFGLVRRVRAASWGTKVHRVNDNYFNGAERTADSVRKYVRQSLDVCGVQ